MSGQLSSSRYLKSGRGVLEGERSHAGAAAGGQGGALQQLGQRRVAKACNGRNAVLAPAGLAFGSRQQRRWCLRPPACAAASQGPAAAPAAAATGRIQEHGIVTERSLRVQSVCVKRPFRRARRGGRSPARICGMGRPPHAGAAGDGGSLAWHAAHPVLSAALSRSPGMCICMCMCMCMRPPVGAAQRQSGGAPG